MTDPNQISSKQAEGMHKLSEQDVVASIINWHIHCCNQLTHVLSAPLGEQDVDGNSIDPQVRPLDCVEDSEEWRSLRPDEYEAFKIGIRYALDTIENLPFKYVMTDADGNIVETVDSGINETENDQSNSV